MSDIASSIRDALAANLNTVALDLACKATVDHPSTPEVCYLGALASARMGAIAEAEKWLARIEREQLGNSALAVDVWCLAGRIAKARYAAASDKTSSTARVQARIAIDSYSRGFSISGSSYPAVNAATMALVSGDAELARTLARQALAAQDNGDDHWQHASTGEALLLLDRIDEAQVRYANAYRLAGNRFGDVAAMRRQLLFIGSAAAHKLLLSVPAPHVIAFSGHMIDHPERASPRFPASLEPKVARVLCEKLANLGPSIGFSQAACGADILFLEAMQDSGRQTHIVLPCAKQDFISASVSFAGDTWVARFERALARATQTILATEEALLGDDALFAHAATVIQGTAFLRAAELSTRPLLLTVREAGSPLHVGGTAATVRTWTRNGGHVENIDLTALRGSGAVDRDNNRTYDCTNNRTNRNNIHQDASVARSEPSATSRTLKSLVFADISGFSRLPEQYTPRFAEMFLGICKRVLDSLEHPAVDANTRGDGLFLVFESPGDAAEFAVRLLEALSAVDWPALGLDPATSARIGLHTGPVFRTFDPVMAKTTFYGTHVNRTARLEPIVQSGQIFVTEAFAASLVAGERDRFRCDYIGAMPLAKQFGEARLYRLHRTNED